MKIQNIPYFSKTRLALPAAACVFGAGMLLCATTASAQEAESTTQPTEKKQAVKQDKYATRLITGKITDGATGLPVPGAIVSAGGAEGYSVLTEDDGTYRLKLPVFSSYISVKSPDHNIVNAGISSQEGQNEIKLYSTAFSAEYGKRISVRTDKQASGFEYSNAINITEELQKKLGGYAYTINRNGTPGIGSVSFVQGLNSLFSNTMPLVVVDDVVMDMQTGRKMLHDGFYNDILTNISPADIENITVLRNGTALYGAKGANGVILITTRRSKSMATRITASLSAGITLEPKFISMMDGNQYRNYASELLKTTNTTIREFKFLNEDPSYYYYKQYHNNTDWKDLVYRNGFTSNYGINIEGGDNIASYNLSVGYNKSNSTLEYNDMDRLNIRFNSDINLSSRFSVKFDASYSNLTRSLRNDAAPENYDDGTPSSPSFLAYAKSPFLSPYSYSRGILSDTHLDIVPESYLDEALANYSNYNYRLANPVALNEYGDAENKNHFENSLLNIILKPKFKINDNLSISEHFSYSLVNTNEKYYIPINGVPQYYVSAVDGYRTNEVRSLFSKQNSVMSDTRVNWANRYDAHNISLFGGVRINWETYTLNSQLGYNTGSDKTPFMSSGLLNSTSSGSKDSWNAMACYLQANYDYLGRYFLQANLTAESSSRFGKDADGLKLLDAVWGVFPSIQASWVVTNEPWMSNVRGLNHLKLNAGFDVSGNDDINQNAARSYLASHLFINQVSGITISGIGNTEIKWETTRRFNTGFESNWLNNRLNLNFNYFKSWTSDLLALQELNFISGLEYNWGNGGKIENEGFDVSASAKIIATPNWQWEMGVSVGHYVNKITELGNGKNHYDTSIYGATVRSEVGQSANLFYGYLTDGVYATTEQAKADGLYILADNGVTRNYFGAGDVRFIDINGDKRIDENDRTVIGNPNPDIYGNIQSALSYKGFKLDLLFNYSLGNDMYNYMRSQLEGGSRFLNQTTVMNRRWQVEGQQTDIPKATFNDPMGNSRFSNRWIEDASYLRLKTVTLSYKLPIKSEYIQGLQFWVQANNVFTVSKYLGADPECASTSAVIGQGIDLGSLAQSRSFVAGVKINL